MRLHLSTWQEVETYLQRSTAILIPIGSTEQHGPTGLIGTDALCPEIIGGIAADESGLLMTPTFNVGVAQHHMEFPGSMTLRPTTFIATMVDWTESLAKHGFTHFYWLNGHGGNISTINAGFAEIYASRSLDTSNGMPPVKCRLRNWWEGKDTYAKCKALYGEAHGSHATPSEVAVTQFAYPDHIKDAPLSPEVAPNGGFTDAKDYRGRFPDGRIGSNPGLATPEAGKVLAELAAGEVVADFQEFAAS
ncbi:MAG: creatininase family protein [Halieaceae bacterium]|jgi:creatinine amidohydrolase|nr:creatininase family protein [Halieaceae bacterium]